MKIRGLTLRRLPVPPPRSTTAGLLGRWCVQFLVVIGALGAIPSDAASASLEDGFLDPPPSARPLAYWFWANGNVSKEGIRADLEDMKKTGLGGGIIFDGSLYLPSGPLRYGTKEWHDHVQFAISTAAELGLQLGVMICPGWATAGGPWNSLDQSMKLLVWSEQDSTAEGWDGLLPVPPQREGYYRDVAVLAVSEDAEVAAEATIEGATVTFRYPEPVKLGTLLLPPRPGATYEGTVEFSVDGSRFEPAASFRESAKDWLMSVPVNFPAIEARAFRVVFKSNPGQEILGGVRFSASPRIPFPAAQAGLVPMPEAATAPGVGTERGVEVIDLTDRLQPDGSLQWSAPPGRWRIIRFGYTTTGATNHPAAEDATGWEVDKFDAAAVEHHLERSVGPIIRGAGAHAGQALAFLFGDSWEAGPQNWTAKMPQLFEQRRGYALRKFLPCFTGRVVDTREKSEAFLRDFRLTLGDLYATEYFGTVARVAHRSGLQFGAQPYGAPFDQFKVNAQLDLPSVEFWLEGISKAHGVVTSVAHTTGRNVVLAEAFTSRPPDDSRWTEVPSRLKAVGDKAYSAGVNLFVLHSYLHQPRSDVAPGFTHGRYGTHFGRLNSWWPLARGWVDYLQRCQLMLQEGVPVADVLFLAPDQLRLEERDLNVPWSDSGLRGDYLAVSQIDSARAENGRIRVRGQTAYRAIVMPGECRVSLAHLRHLGRLREEGAVILGPFIPKPAGVSDVGNPEWEREAASWTSLAELPAPWGVPPDFLGEEGLRFLHRATPDADIYFVCNPQERAVESDLRFRVTGRHAEFWDPLTGKIHPVVARPEGDYMVVSHRFVASGSGFFVFADKPLSRAKTAPADVPGDSREIVGPWKVSFQPGRGAPEGVTLDRLVSWPDHADQGVRHFSGVAVYAKEIDVPSGLGHAVLDLGQVFDMAEVLVNGKTAGIVWMPPFQVEVGHLLVPGANTLEVRVANRWINRLIGDEKLPPDTKHSGPEVSTITRGALLEFPPWWEKPNARRDRVAFATWRHYDGSEELVPAGLLGPVILRSTQ
jgi:hypothetical protein